MESTLEKKVQDNTRVKAMADSFIASVNKVLVGKKDIVKLIFVALLCEGHVLLDDVPGVGKTLLAKAASRSLGCSFKRIQCTPDLLPSDVTGIQFYNQKSGSFEFRHGPIVANIVLVDEINRATPRTQSCFMECMQEQQITIDMDTIQLPHPFLLIATQNPVEMEGTFPLPEAQLDRFLLRLRLGYPSEEDEGLILSRFQVDSPLNDLTAVLDANELLKLKNICRQVFVEESVRHYVLALARATRTHHEIKLGASPRASLALFQAAQSLAAINGRNYVIPDDVISLAHPVLEHRLIIQTAARLKGRSSGAIVNEIISTIPVPVEETL